MITLSNAKLSEIHKGGVPYEKGILVLRPCCTVGNETLSPQDSKEAAKPKVTVFWPLYDGLTEEYRRICRMRS